MKHSIENKNNNIVLKISDDVTIQNIAELKKILCDNFKSGVEITIDHEKITDVDLTYYQFLVSLSNSAKPQNVKIKLNKYPDCFQKLYGEIGIRGKNELKNIFRG